MIQRQLMFLLLSLASFIYNVHAEEALSGDAPQHTAVAQSNKLNLSSFFKPLAEGEQVVPPSIFYTFSGATADSINYLQLCHATDNTCSSCSVPFATITTGTPISYSTSGTRYAVSPTSIGAYLAEYGFSSSGTPYNIGMYVQSSHLDCASNTSYCSANSDTSSHALCIQATYQAGSVTALTRSDNGNVLLNAATQQYSYVAGYDGHVYYCTLNSDGSFNTCTITPSSGVSFTDPTGVAFATVGETQYGYVADANSGFVYRCTLNSNGTFNVCSPSQALGGPNTVAFATVNQTQYAYVANVSNVSPSVYQCTLNSNGTFNTCTTTPSSGAPAWTPTGVTFATVGGTHYAYVTSNSGLVYNCTLNSDGTFNTCSSVGQSFSEPLAIAFATVNGTQYAYVADKSAGTISICTLDTVNGAFAGCSSTGAPSPLTYTGLTFTTVNGVQSAYLANQGLTALPGFMYQCSINNTNGTFSSCNQTPASGAPASWKPSGVASAYIRP